MGAKVTEKTGPKADHKMLWVVRSWDLKGDELGEFVRRKGIYLSDLKSWKEDMKVGLERDLKLGRETRKYYRDKISQLEKKVKQLERNLAEAKLVADIKKKVREILEVKGKNTAKKLGKKSSGRSKSGKLKD